MSAKVYLGKSIAATAINPNKLMKRAEAVASSLMLPAGVEFARFEHNGQNYALSARLIIEVDRLSARVPDVVIRSGDRSQKPK
jgi:hypothetical protein